MLWLVIQANYQSRVALGAPSKQLSSPDQADWSPEMPVNIRENVEEIDSTSVMIVQHGEVVAAWDVATPTSAVTNWNSSGRSSALRSFQ